MVFIWPMISGVYLGFSFLARAKGRVERRRGEWEVLTGVMEKNYYWRKNMREPLKSIKRGAG